MKQAQDTALIRQVHSERIGPYTITASLTRFGGLCVIAESAQRGRDTWQGENIIEARAWVGGQITLWSDVVASTAA